MTREFSYILFLVNDAYLKYEEEKLQFVQAQTRKEGS